MMHRLKAEAGQGTRRELKEKGMRALARDPTFCNSCRVGGITLFYDFYDFF